jgi:hypothetical protein
VSGEASVKLDCLPWDRSPLETSAVEHWINSGQGHAAIDDITDISDDRNFTILKDSAVRALKKLNMWAMSTKFYRMLESFNWAAQADTFTSTQLHSILAQ